MSMEYKLPFTAKEVEERLEQFTFDAENNTLNVVADTTNFGDAVSVGRIVGDIRVKSAPIEPLHFGFICDGVEYAGIQEITEHNEYVGDVTCLYYLKDDGSKETAYDYFVGQRYLSDLIQPINMAEFLEIYNDNKEYFDADISQGIRIGNIIVNENKVNSLSGLAKIGSFSMCSFEQFTEYLQSSFTGGDTTLNSVLRKTRFIGIDEVLFPFAIKIGTDYTQGYEKLAILIYGEGFPTVGYPVETDYSPHTFTLYR